MFFFFLQIYFLCSLYECLFLSIECLKWTKEVHSMPLVKRRNEKLLSVVWIM